MIKRFFIILNILGKWYWRSFIRIRSADDVSNQKRAQTLRESLEHLGSVFVKFGQLLAMRPDILSRAYCRELFYLLDDVPPFSSEIIKRTIVEDFGKSPEFLFESFDESPIAAASFGQVHTAVTRDKEKVAVKVQRPNIEFIVERDIKLMKVLARVIDVFRVGVNKLAPIVKEFEMWTREELDYEVEANYTQRFHKQTSSDGIYAPKVYKDLSSKRVLTAEYVPGAALSKILIAYRDQNTKTMEQVEDWGFSRKDVAFQLLRNSTKQIYLEGFFHADPHPANIIFTPEKKLVYIDFGIVGELGRRERLKCLRYTRSAMYGEEDHSFDALVELCDTSKVKDMNKFKEEHSEIIRKTLQMFNKAKETGTSQIVGKKLVATLQLLQKHGARIQTNTMRYFRTLLAVDSLILEVYPEMELKDIARRFRNVSIANIIQELPDHLDAETFEKDILKWLSILETELIK
ncbi:MAG: ABC1 kinase family protein [Patescibacteria group bacterium]